MSNYNEKIEEIRKEKKKKKEILEIH